MTAIHVQRGHGGAYEEPCRTCEELFSIDANTPGCADHFYGRKIRRKGNPRLDAEMQSALKRHYREHQDYIPQGDSALTPVELIEIRKFMLSYEHGNSAISLSLWTSF